MKINSLSVTASCNHTCLCVTIFKLCLKNVMKFNEVVQTWKLDIWFEWWELLLSDHTFACLTKSTN